MAVRLFVGNLSYSTTEADLRTYFGAVAPPSQVVLPVDRETGRPRGFAFVEFIDRAHAEQAIQQFNGQPFNGRPLAVSEARAREDRGPGGPPRPAATRPARDRPAADSRRARRRIRRSAASVRLRRQLGAGRRRRAQPQFRPRRQAAARRQREGQEEGRRQAARPDSDEEHRPLVQPRRCRRAGRSAAGYRRHRHEQAARRTGQGRRT